MSSHVVLVETPSTDMWGVEVKGRQKVGGCKGRAEKVVREKGRQGTEMGHEAWSRQPLMRKVKERSVHGVYL